MNTTHISCRHCSRISFLDAAVACCPYCGSKEIDTTTTNRSDATLSAMGFTKLNEVEAGPGTAKTTALVFRARYLIHYRRDGIHKPLILTFTNQAVDSSLF